MKKIIAAALILVMVLTCAGCKKSSLFSDDSIVKLGEEYKHREPDDLKYDERSVLNNEDFKEFIESSANAEAYPDTTLYDDEGNVIGIYDYDETTGLAAGWTNIQDGSYTELEEPLDIGKPDESKMVSIKGDVSLWFVIYEKDDKATAAYMYLILSDEAAKDTVVSAMKDVYGIELEDEEEKVLKFVEDEDFIDGEFDKMEEYGATYNTRNMKAYMELLNYTYGVKSYGTNPYEPYEGHEDPTDLEYDDKLILTGPGTYAVAEEYSGSIVSMTDYLYGKDDVTVAQYTYYEFDSKEIVDEIEKNLDRDFINGERVSDTVIRSVVDGKDMEDILNTYVGYDVIPDKSLASYAKNIEDGYFSSIY